MAYSVSTETTGFPVDGCQFQNYSVSCNFATLSVVTVSPGNVQGERSNSVPHSFTSNKDVDLSSSTAEVK